MRWLVGPAYRQAGVTPKGAKAEDGGVCGIVLEQTFASLH